MVGLTVGSDSWNDRKSYCEFVLSATSARKMLPSKLLSVETGGKHRIVSKSDLAMNVLRPLHSSIYNHIARYDWLLRGDAKAARFRDFKRKEGEVFVSGDYESATDNLNLHVQRQILDVILDHATCVPEGVKSRARESQTMGLDLNGEIFRQSSGQLMGNLLSFPLLCIVNYLSFRFSCGTQYPVRVNGDDIVFRAPRRIADRWMDNVSLSGLTLSRGKTSVSPSFFSLNSRLFKAGFKKVSLVPCIRSTSYFGVDGGASSLRGRSTAFCEGFSGPRRSVLRVEWLKWNRGMIDSTRRSITRGLGIGFRYDELVNSGLWAREAFYLSFEKETPLPAREVYEEKLLPPEGWRYCTVSKLTREIRRKQKEVGPLIVEQAWNTVLTPKGDSETTFLSALRQGGADCWSFFQQRCRDLKKRSGLLRISRRNTIRFLRPVLTEDLRRKMGEYRLWKHTVLLPVVDNVTFVREGGEVYHMETPTRRLAATLEPEDEKENCTTELVLPPGFSGIITCKKRDGFWFSWAPPACLA